MLLSLSTDLLLTALETKRLLCQYVTASFDMLNIIRTLNNLLFTGKGTTNTILPQNFPI